MLPRALAPSAALLALIGYWSPWLTHRAAALRMNGYELSEWVTFLPGVRDGSLPIGRLSLLIPLVCLTLLLGLVAAPQADALPANSVSRAHGWPRRLAGYAQTWGLMALGLACSLVIFPPYPYILSAYADPEYQAQFFVAAMALVGVPVARVVPDELKALLQLLLAGTAGGFALWTLLSVRPVAAELLAAPWAIGAGWAVMLLGFAGLLASAGLQLFGPKW